MLAFFGCSDTQKIDKSVVLELDDNFTQSVNIAPISVDFKKTIALNNKAAYVTSQCYTKTLDENNQTHNPCFSCHINSQEPNYINDADLQTIYDMREYTKTNRFSNLFKDRTEYVNSISDKEILEYVNRDNYKDENSTLYLAQKLKTPPSNWDVDANGVWSGYSPDCHFNFDEEGFDKEPSGEYSGWRAFAYYPFLGTFWPTNGSFDDVLIRLERVFMEDENSTFDVEVYKINLAIVEALIKREDIAIESVDESLYGVDLDHDGKLGRSTLVKYEWKTPTYNSSTGLIGNFSMQYVGKARKLLQTNEYLIAPGLYPKGTEFLHSVRYINLEDGNVTMANRMKELRYAKKESWNSYSQTQNAAMAEIMEKDLFPERLRTIKGNSEEGLLTGLGWRYQGFIEDEYGELRPQNYEETLYCIGCHSGIGAISDSTFAFQRKFAYWANGDGWSHWSQTPNALNGLEEPLTKDGRYEYSLYLEKNGAGDEFRSNDEVMENYFENGVLKSEKIEELHSDVSKLLLPSSKRALELNKAYWVIVKEQSFIYGRDAHVKPLVNIHREVNEAQSTQNDMIVIE